ncbi:hypothetical protein NQ317_008864 [Molorchus minor]|uniref:Uncharacterized protein n=1 Tax=Molorchus minor TaxID=1323400 RepID=A0ABQ9J5D0_9CUCU|nr:hypothetical protein NQ317_008864 [Molorchus minor]
MVPTITASMNGIIGHRKKRPITRNLPNYTDHSITTSDFNGCTYYMAPNPDPNQQGYIFLYSPY